MAKSLSTGKFFQFDVGHVLTPMDLRNRVNPISGQVLIGKHRL